MKRSAADRAQSALPNAISASLAVLAIASFAGAVSGCSHSPPMRYVTLSAVTAPTPPARVQINPVQLTAVHIPAELDRPEVVTQVAANRLSVDEGTRWGAPLAQMMRRTLAEDLLARLPEGAFVLPESPAPADTHALVVTVLDLQADPDKMLTLQAAWTLSSGHPARVMLTQQATLYAPMTKHDAASQAASLSRILGQLADRIAASIPSR